MLELSSLPRVWWFPPIGLLERSGLDAGAYWAYPLDQQPDVRADAVDDLAWLSEQPEASEWGIDSSDATPSRRLDPRELGAVLSGRTAPKSLAALAATPALQRRIRSITGCYLDLGDFVAPVEGGGVLLHFLSDQQWVRHLVCVAGRTGGSADCVQHQPDRLRPSR